MPSHWVDLAPRDDYGIDRHIEVFELLAGDSGDSVPTGLDFGVQLKATGGESSRASSVGINWSTMNYWWLKPYPVLLVRFMAANNQLFGRWAHNRPDGLEDERAQAWFRFDDSHALEKGGKCWEEIVEEVRSFQRVRERAISLPLTLRFRGTRATTMNSVRVNADLRRRLGDESVLVEFGSADSTSVLFSDDRIGVNLGGPIGVYFHFAQPEVPDAAALLLALGLCFGRINQWPEAARCIQAAADASQLNDLGWLTLTASLCAAAGRSELALELIDQFAEEHGGHHELTPTLAMIVFEAADNDAIVSPLEALLTKWPEAANPGPDRSSMHFNLGMILQSAGSHASAIGHFEKCLAESLRYHDREYFWIYFARMLVGVGRFETASDAYGRACEISGTYADVACETSLAALHAGRYRRAAEVIAESVAERGIPTAQESLLGLVAEHVLHLAGCDEQDRKPSEAAKRWGAEVTEQANLNYDIASILDLDALFVPGWVWMSQAVPDTVEVPFSTQALITAAWIQQDEPNLWAGALVSAEDWGFHEEQLLTLVRLGRTHGGPTFDSHVVGTVDRFLDGSKMTVDDAEHILGLLVRPLGHIGEPMHIRDAATGTFDEVDED